MANKASKGDRKIYREMGLSAEQSKCVAWILSRVTPEGRGLVLLAFVVGKEISPEANAWRTIAGRLIRQYQDYDSDLEIPAWVWATINEIDPYVMIDAEEIEE